MGNAMAGRGRVLLAGLLAAACLPWIAGGASAGAASAATPPAGGSSWTVYHANPAGTGAAGPVSAVNTGTRAWTSPALDGDIYGEPLVWDGRVYVATENDTVYALSAATGAVAWSSHLGSPVPAGQLPCGDITPVVGITGTPVIDQSRAEIFVVADELVRGASEHVLAGLSAASGAAELTEDVDPPGAEPAALLQRTGLNLTHGQVIFAMGGNFGDCPSYRGRVAAVPETGGPARYFTVDAGSGQSQGAVWMGGAAPTVDGAGNVWVTSGNGSVTSSSQPYDDSDAALELSPSMRLLQFFAPTTWPSDNASDRDMSTAPALLADGQVVAAGKSGQAYLLSGAHLGGIGGQQATLAPACSEVIDGGFATAGTTVYLPCLSGIVAARAAASPPALQLLWRAGTGGGPPVIAAGLVWTIGRNGVLYGLSAGTGRVAQQAQVGTLANHFPTPSVADGLLLVPAARDVVVAFTATGPGAAGATTPATTPAPHPTRSPGAAPGGGLAPGAIAVIVIAAVVVLAGGTWLLRRRLRR